ncbi:TIR domain-containing protein [Candidatus Weimeria sp. HCP3S3_B5]|uniref:TIR domain-containing protein n=1 Tax=Candidatus Weimeria sp. HCP3S3_B5 TaxID=3438871 RepID=UPI003F89EAB1
MAYRNKVYVSFDADSDINYYRLMRAWTQNDNTNFNFYDAHDVNNNYDKSEASIKASLEERFRNSKVFVLLVGEHTRFLYKYVRWEIEQAIRRELPIIVVNINGMRQMDEERCPAIVRNQLAVHISFNEKILQFALENWPDEDARYRREDKIGPFQYNYDVYRRLGL